MNSLYPRGSPADQRLTLRGSMTRWRGSPARGSPADRCLTLRGSMSRWRRKYRKFRGNFIGDVSRLVASFWSHPRWWKVPEVEAAYFFDVRHVLLPQHTARSQFPASNPPPPAPETLLRQTSIFLEQYSMRIKTLAPRQASI